MRLFIVLVFVAPVLLLDACAPYAYRPEIGALSDGITAAAVTYQSGSEAISDGVADSRKAALVAGRAAVHMSQGCDQMGAKGGACVVLGPNEGAPPPPTAMEAHLAAAAPAFGALQSYAAGLMAVTEAKDDANLAASTTRLTTSLAGVAAAAAHLYPPIGGAGAVIQSAGALGGKALTLYLDGRRLKVLKEVVPRADPSVAELSRTVGAALEVVRRARMQRMEADLHRLQEAIDANPASLASDDYAGQLVRLQNAAAAFNAARGADPATVADRLRTAHAALARALQARHADHAVLYKAALDFANEAAALKAQIAPPEEAAR